MTAQTKYIVRPETDEDDAPYWQSLRDHQAKLQKCPSCKSFRFPPFSTCYNCGTEGGEWTPISGKGKVYTWTVVHHPLDPRLKTEVPFILALIELEEGPRIAGRLVNCDSDQKLFEMPVKARYDDLDNDFTLINFEPA
jgi:uncharacterized OB-fold protein